MTKCSWKTRDLTLKAIILELCPLFKLFLSRMMAPDRWALVPHAVLLFYFSSVWLLLLLGFIYFFSYHIYFTFIVVIIKDKDMGDFNKIKIRTYECLLYLKTNLYLFVCIFGVLSHFQHSFFFFFFGRGMGPYFGPKYHEMRALRSASLFIFILD